MSVIGLKNKKTTKIDIPKTVAYGGKSFKVTAIADKAFWKSKAKEVTVGDNVKNIGVSAFSGCTKLTQDKNSPDSGRRIFSEAKIPTDKRLYDYIDTCWKLLIYNHNLQSHVLETEMVDYMYNGAELPRNMIPLDTDMPNYRNL